MCTFISGKKGAVLNTIIVDGQSVTPSKIICIGRNYVEHAVELGNEVPEEPVIFMKPNSAIGEQLQSSHGNDGLHYEGELCFVVKGGSFASVGFGLDLTKRKLQGALKSKGLPWERAKAFDGAAVFGAFVSLPEGNDSLSLELTIDGELIQQGEVSQMMFPPVKILSYLQKFLTLEDGDVVMTGTPKGVGAVVSKSRFEGVVRSGEQVIAQGSWTAE